MRRLELSCDDCGAVFPPMASVIVVSVRDHIEVCQACYDQRLALATGGRMGQLTELPMDPMLGVV